MKQQGIKIKCYQEATLQQGYKTWDELINIKGKGGGGVEWINYEQLEGFVWTITMKERIKIPWTSTQREMRGVQPLIVIMKH
jgi:hypothetical protein